MAWLKIEQYLGVQFGTCCYQLHYYDNLLFLRKKDTIFVFLISAVKVSKDGRVCHAPKSLPHSPTLFLTFFALIQAV